MEIKNISSKLGIKAVLGGGAQSVKNYKNSSGLCGNGQDKLEISGESFEFFRVAQSLKEEVKKPADKGTVAELTKQVAAGEYHINYHELASDMVK